MSSRLYLQMLLINSFWEKLQELPNNFERIMSNAIAFLIAICFGLGVILSIIGVVKWATGWDDKGGKKTVVKGVVLIAISLVAGGVGVTIVTYT